MLKKWGEHSWHRHVDAAKTEHHIHDAMRSALPFIYTNASAFARWRLIFDLTKVNALFSLILFTLEVLIGVTECAHTECVRVHSSSGMEKNFLSPFRFVHCLFCLYHFFCSIIRFRFILFRVFPSSSIALRLLGRLFGHIQDSIFAISFCVCQRTHPLTHTNTTTVPFLLVLLAYLPFVWSPCRHYLFYYFVFFFWFVSNEHRRLATQKHWLTGRTAKWEKKDPFAAFINSIYFSLHGFYFLKIKFPPLPLFAATFAQRIYTNPRN